MLASQRDVADAVAAADTAFEEWSQTSLSKRTKVLFAFRELVNRQADELAGLIVDEHGKVFSDALGEVQRGLEVVEFACGIPTLLKGDYSDQVSAGVDTFSFRRGARGRGRHHAVQLPGDGPDVDVPGGHRLRQHLRPQAQRAGPVGVALRRGPLAAGGAAGRRLQRRARRQGVASTRCSTTPASRPSRSSGSTPIAQYIHQRGSANGKRVQALGGAKNHAIVLPDADVDFAAEHLAAAAFGSAGERCMAISAAVAVGSAADAVVEAVSDKARAVTVGSGRDAASEMGPVVTRAAQERIEGLIASGEAQGARLAVDGRGHSVPGFENGFFVGPTVIDAVTTEMDVYREEIFGPVLSVVRADSVDEAIALINANPYGNGTAIFTSSGESARRFQRGVKVGMIGINVPVPVPMAYYSFGGWKNSLFGDKHVHGPEGVSSTPGPRW